MFEMKKEQYKMSKEWAAMRYKSDPKYRQAHYQYELADCDADYSKYQDPAWQKANSDYRYYKDFGLDKEYNPTWLQVKFAMTKANKDVKIAKQ